MKKRFRMQFVEGYTPSKGVTLDSLSLTVPDQAMSIREILLRYARGLGAPQSRPMYYSGDEVLPNLDSMTDMDKLDLYRATIADVEAKEKELIELRDKRVKAVRERREKELSELDMMRQYLAKHDGSKDDKAEKKP